MFQTCFVIVWVFLLSSLFVVSCLILLLLAQGCYSYYYFLLDVIVPFVAPCSMFFAWHHYSLFDAIAPLVAPFSTLLFFLLLFAWWCCPLLNIATPLATTFTTPCSMLLLLLLLLVWHCCSSIAPCSTLLFFLLLFGQLTAPLVVPWWTLLLNIPWSMLLFLYSFILDTTCSSTFLICCDVVVPLLLIRCYYSYSSYFRLVFPPLIFCRCGKNFPNSNFQTKLRRWDFFFNICLLMNIFVIHVVFGKFWLTMCFFVVYKNYLDIVCLIIHIAFHLHNCIVYFSTHCIFFLKSFTCL
jgi:hypothetical protein